MSSILRPYQQEGVNKIFTEWKAGNKRVMFQLVTGGGKTVCFTDIIKKFLVRDRRVMMLAHREELISQGYETLYRNKILSGIIKAGITPNYSLPCQVASIQTAIRRKQLPKSDLIIFDEAHHCQDDNSYGNLLEMHYPDAYVLGVTATPYRLGGAGFTNLFSKLITGPTFKDLVAMGYLTPLRYYVASRPDLTAIKIDKGDYVVEEAAKAMEMAPLVESYMEHCQGMCGVVFAVNIEHSNKIVNQYSRAGVRAAHLDANTPSEQRKEILKRFRNKEIQVISNVGIITEGFDFPDMEFVQLARPTKSLSLFLQMIGRVTRPDANAIREAKTDEERTLAIAMSKKPFGYVLDNAGLWEEHGMPDQVFNWNRYFNGIPKRKKKIEDFIEIVEFVAEDSTGVQRRTMNPSEIEGLKLIEVNKQIKERIINLTSLKEFDKSLSMFKNIPKLTEKNKAGFAAFKSYKDYCRKNNFMMTTEIWDYLIRKLCHDPEEIIANAERDILTIRFQYRNDEEEQRRLLAPAEMRIVNARKYLVPEGYLKRERAAYFKNPEPVPA